MYKVYIDTSDRFKSIVRLYNNDDNRNDTGSGGSNNNKVVDEISGEIDVVSAIKTILETNGLLINDISKFEMNEGPGSFTGLRVGISIANALSFAGLIRINGKKIGEIEKPTY